MIDTANTVTPPQKVLIIDDEPAIRDSLRMMLADKYTVFCAGSVRNGLDILHDFTSDVILLDVCMPEINEIDSLQTGLHHGNCVDEITEQQQQSLDLCYDLVNNLTSVCVPQQLLPEHLDGNSAHDPRRLSKLTRTGVEQIERCLEVIRKFYDNSSEHLMQDLKPTALDAVVGEVADACRLKTTRRYAGIQLDVDIEPCKIEGDRIQLFRALSNIAANALEAMSDTGGRLEIGCGMGEGHVEVTFRDNGCGIDSALVTDIFRPYFTTKQAPSAGLGLCIAKRVIDYHEGVIKVLSSTGAGTTFIVQFPALQQGEV
jgi:signal transduction histidine kinase